MINSTEILEKLKNGESIDDIANSITKVLNIAQQDYIKFQEEEKVRKAAALKRQELATILSTFINWGKAYYPKYFNKEDTNIENLTNSVLELFDILNEYGELVMNPASLLEFVSVDNNTTKSKEKKDDWDSLFKSFIGAD